MNKRSQGIYLPIILIVVFACSTGPLFAQSIFFTTKTPTIVSGAGNRLGINLPIVNSGTATASAVSFTSVKLGTAPLVAPVKFPETVGNIGAGVQFTADLTVDGTNLKVGSKYLLTVSGTYRSGTKLLGFSVNRYVTVPGPTAIALGDNKTDQLWEHAQTADGTTVDYFGTKASTGYAQALQSVFVKNKSGLYTYGFDAQGRLVSSRGADGSTFNVIWSSSTSAVVIAISADGTRHAAVSLNFATPSKNRVLSPLAKEPLNTDARGWLREETSSRADRAPSCDSRVVRTLTPQPSGVCGKDLVCTQVTECGPSDSASVTLGYSTNFTATTLPAALLAPGTGIYETQMPTPGATAQGFENVCSAVQTGVENLCTAAEAVLPSACLALAVTPETVEFVPPCLVIAEKLKIACEVNGGGLPPGAPSIFDGFCQVVTNVIDLAAGTTVTLSPIAEIPGVGTLAGPIVTAPIGGPYPTILSIAFPGNVTIQSFTTDPVNPPAGVGYTATAVIKCAPANTVVNLSIVGTDGFTESVSCTVEGNSLCAMFVPGAAPGVVDTLTAQIPGGPTATAINVFQ